MRRFVATGSEGAVFSIGRTALRQHGSESIEWLDFDATEALPNRPGFRWLDPPSSEQGCPAHLGCPHADCEDCHPAARYQREARADANEKAARRAEFVRAFTLAAVRAGHVLPTNRMDAVVSMARYTWDAIEAEAGKP
jgi:hypothetical protein